MSDFEALARAIAQTHQKFATQVTRAVNLGLTLRNWLIGRHIVDYELTGHDRAAYGERLFTQLAQRLRAMEIPGSDRRELYRYCDFYRCYPQLAGTLSPQWQQSLPGLAPLTEFVGTASPPSDPALASLFL